MKRQHAKMVREVIARFCRRRGSITGSTPARARAILVSLLVLLSFDIAVAQQIPPPPQDLVREVDRELTGIDTTAETGDTARAADAMAARRLAAGFSRQDVRVFNPAPRKDKLAFSAMLRVPSVATRLVNDAAVDALPPTASVTRQCRMRPGDIAEETLAALCQALGDDQVKVSIEWAQPGRVSSTMTKVAARFWPALPIVPVRSPNATDSSLLRNAGIPSFGFDGLRSNLTDFRVYGNDERISVTAFDEGHEALDQLLSDLSAP